MVSRMLYDDKEPYDPDEDEHLHFDTGESEIRRGSFFDTPDFQIVHTVCRVCGSRYTVNRDTTRFFYCRVCGMTIDTDDAVLVDDDED